VAKISGIKSILLTGKGGGKCADYADCCIKVPADETYKIQEYHLPVYHALCAMLEDYFYGSK
jgi:D-sedoheptulose 7-phosphate isomerase